jgi:hypothetical protein
VSLTHADLVDRARRWLLRRKCPVVITEMTSAAGCTPDAIGWQTRYSIQVECKVSYGDFRRDGDKPSKRSKNEVGTERWYLVPPALAKRLADTDLGGWGLLVADDRQGSAARILRRSQRFTLSPWGARNEMALLVSALRRHTWSAGRAQGINCRLYSPERVGSVVGDGRATLGVRRPIPAPVTREELLERDRVWCQALGIEDLDVVERVATRFNQLRPDPQREAESAEPNA